MAGVVAGGRGSDAYAGLAEHYHLIYDDWHAAMRRQAAAIDGVVRGILGAGDHSVLDCSCGIGTQALGLAQLGYRVHGTDLSGAEIARARREAAALGVDATFAVADMRALAEDVGGTYDVVLSADNAIAHLLTEVELEAAFSGMRASLRAGGVLVVSVRDYDATLIERPHVGRPSVFDGPDGRRIRLSVFDWDERADTYRTSIFLTRQVGEGWATVHWSADSRAWRRAQVDAALRTAGVVDVRWWTPEQTGFFQQLVTATHG
jgi:glycine/sarcosine N-methyltransferase